MNAPADEDLTPDGDALREEIAEQLAKLPSARWTDALALIANDVEICALALGASENSVPRDQTEGGAP
jgi:hypothetical protein